MRRWCCPRAGDRVVHDFGRAVTFNGVTGQMLGSTPEQPLAMAVGGAFYGLHMGHFAGPVLRWLYFICGLAGTAMIGTGLVIWLGKRQLKHAKSGVMPFELRLVEVLNIASMAGLVIGGGGVFPGQSSVAGEPCRTCGLGSECVLHRLGLERAARDVATGAQGLG